MAFSVPSTLEKMNSRDKDFRYMATADLEVELKKDTFKMDADSEKKLTTMVLKLLEDNSNQVQELAVKCLGPLSKRVKEAQVQDIVDTLCNHLLNEKKGGEELRDIANIGLKTVISEIPVELQSLSSLVIKRLTPRLITGISLAPEGIKLDIITFCLEALNDLLSKFASQMSADHEKLLKVVEPQLASKRPASRKWAISCLGHLASTIPDTMFTELIKNHIQQIKQIESSGKKEGDKLHTYIQAIDAISRSVGYRLGKFLGEIAPLIIKYCEDGKSGDELKEDCFQCFESLISRCPKEVTPYLPKIIDLCLVYIKYDPNYAEDDAEDMETDEQEDEEDEDDDGGDEDYSDDDDMSWKVRRSSTKCLSVIIITRPELLQEVYTKVAPVLIARFKEREENVKLDIFSAFVDLLKQTNVLLKRNPELATSPSNPVRDLVPKVIAGITKQLKEKSVKTRSGAFSLLKELVVVLKGSLSTHIGVLVPGIVAALSDKSSNSTLKIDGLTFLRLLMASHQANVFHEHIKTLAPHIFKAVRDPYYRISAEGLRVCCELVKVLRPEGSTFDYKPFINELFNATLEKLKVQDIDQEVKESAINCMGLIISTFGDDLKSELPAVLNILQDRLGNEITRLTTVNALQNIASSKLHPDISPILGESIKSISSFLRQTNRQLKQSSLATLSVVIRKYGADKKASDLFKQVLTELSPLISEADLHLTHLALSICTAMLQVSPASASLVSTDVLQKSVDLFRSNLLQGLALESLLNMLSELVKINSKGLGFDVLLEKLLSIANGQKEVTKQVLSNIAKGVSALCLATDSKQRDATVSRFVKDLTRKEEWAKHLALYCLGEIGRKTDLSSQSGLEKSILQAFESTNEETRQAASFALGNVAVGSLSNYLPKILDEIKKSPNIKYLLLHSLREIIVRQSATSEGAAALKQQQKDLLPLLFQNCENEEEGTRNVVAECLGKLAVLSPEELVPSLVEKVQSPSAFTRSTVVTALKFAIVEKSTPVDQLLKPQISKFLELLKDKDVNVRRNTLLMLNYAAHNKPFLVRDVLSEYLPLIFAESKIKPELIREVDLGPFKHKVDDGLEVRKASFECLYTLVDSCLDKLNIPAFISNLVDGLKDQNDIKTLSHLMIIRLAALSGSSLLEGLDQLIEPLRSTLATKAKEGAVQQEVDRNDELVRSALRSIYSISRIPNVESNPKWDEFLRTTVKVGDIGEKYASIKAEGEHAERSSDAMDLS